MQPVSVAVSPDGKPFATASDDGSAKLWDAATGTELHTLRDEQNPPLYLSFSPDGTRIYAGGDGHTLAAWDVAVGAEALARARAAGVGREL